MEKRQEYERQKGKCVKCGKTFEIQEMEADHVKPRREGGKTIAVNCQMLCRDDNRRRSGRRMLRDTRADRALIV